MARTVRSNLAPSFSFELKGLDGVLRALDNVLDAVASETALRKAALAGAEVFLEGARARVPRGQTGDLEKSLTMHIIEELDGDGPDEALAGVGPGLRGWYGRFPEFGTRHAAAKPYLRPTVDTESGAATTAALTELRRRVQAWV